MRKIWLFAINVAAILVILALAWWAELVQMFLPGRSGLHTYNFSASKEHYAFLHRTAERKHVLVVVDDRARKISAYDAATGPILAAQFLMDGRLQITVGPRINPPFSPEGLESTLYTCDLGTASCARAFSSSGTIKSAMPISGGRFLFVGAYLETTADPMAPTKPFLAYRSFDFYLYAPDRALTNLTDSRAFQLGPVSYGGGQAVFDMAQRKPPGTKRPTSEVFCARVDQDFVPIDFAADTAEPCVSYGRDIDVYPNISPDGKHVAFLSASDSNKSGWIYEIVIVEMGSKRHVRSIRPREGETMSLSPPVFIDDDTIRYVERVGDTYAFYSYSISTGKVATHFELDSAQITNSTPHIIGQAGE
jgi:hypothetical protein